MKEGYLQNKIRELNEKIDLLEKKVGDSLEREKNIVKAIRDTSKSERERTSQYMKELIFENIDLMYKEKFKDIFQKKIDEINHNTSLNAKGFNHSINSLLKEITLLKKDNDFLNNLIINKLKISQEDFFEFCKLFDKKYPKEMQEERMNKFKMKIYTDRKKVEDILKDKDSHNKDSANDNSQQTKSKPRIRGATIALDGKERSFIRNKTADTLRGANKGGKE